MAKEIIRDSLIRFVNKNYKSFPCPVKCINILQDSNGVSLIFNYNKVDVTSYFSVTPIYNDFKDIVVSLELEPDNYFYLLKIPEYYGRYINKWFVKNIRTKKGLGVVNLSFDMGTNTPTIYSMEDKITYEPKIGTLLKYCYYFNAPIYKFLSKKHKEKILKTILNNFAVKGYFGEDLEKAQIKVNEIMLTEMED